jgi:TonB-dependent SusC/RagA subfamily outer membrane receptor
MKAKLGLTMALLLAGGWESAHAQTRFILGRVIDSVTSEPVTAGTVTLLGTKVKVPVRQDGTFVIYAPIREVTVAVEGIGYRSRDMVVPQTSDVLVVPLRRDYFELDAVVVTGQATGIERRNLANAVGKVRGEDLSRVPAQTVDEALKGKVTGAAITSNSGAPGGGITVRLRGVTSIIGNSDPLFIVDGVIVSNASIPGGTNAVTRAQPGVLASMQENPANRLADLNPNDIESIEILKGASASAMYGSKASNGVVIITTKRGRYVNQ